MVPEVPQQGGRQSQAEAAHPQTALPCAACQKRWAALAHTCIAFRLKHCPLTALEVEETGRRSSGM